MCQLTLINHKNQLTAKLLGQALSYINADRGNKDGYGCIINGEIKCRTVLSPTESTLYMDTLSEVKKEDVILFHCRSASVGIKVTLDNVHPFEFEHIIGMHNGTLYFKDEKPANKNEESRESDSKRFFESLNRNYTGNMVEDLNETMKDVTGKFAFIIYDKDKKKTYVVRGKTAQLHFTILLTEKTGGDAIGLVVNTDKSCLEKAITQIAPVNYMLNRCTLWYTPIAEVATESIFEYNPRTYELVKIGDLKENAVVYSTPVSAGRQVGFSEYGYYGRNWLEDDDSDLTEKAKLEDKFVSLYLLTGCLMQDLDKFCSLVIDKSFSSMTKDDLEFMVDYLLPKITLTQTELDDIEDIFGRLPSHHDLICAGLAYPIKVNKVKTLKKGLRKLATENQNRIVKLGV